MNNDLTRQRILFLDVDGVLNCWSTKDTWNGHIGIDDKKVALLKEIIDATHADIVLVSTWKEGWIKEKEEKAHQDKMASYLDEKLAKAGLFIKDKTINEVFWKRGEGILSYLRKAKEEDVNIASIAILDDEIFDYEETGLLGYLSLTDFDEGGLKKMHVREAIATLQPQGPSL